MKVEEFAPISIFVYRRVDLVRQVIESLQRNLESSSTDLYIFSDGPKLASDIDRVKEVRRFVSQISGFKSVTLVFGEQNLGLAQSFINGISQILKSHKFGIFLEDDNLVSPFFISFMNQALVKYQNDTKIICVTGYSHPIWPKRRRPYFLKGAQTWSMGTWAEKWKFFDENSENLMSKVTQRQLVGELRIYGTDYYGMLNRQLQGRIDSWGVRWMVSAIINDMYCYYPPIAHCRNIGNTKDATHSRIDDALLIKPAPMASGVLNCFPVISESYILKPLYMRIMMKRINFQHRIFRIKRSLAKGF